MNNKELIGEVIYRWIPDRSKFDRPDIADVPHEYVVTKCDDALCGIIVYGKYHGKWHVNPSGRALIAHLLDIIQLYRLKRFLDYRYEIDSSFKHIINCDYILNAIGESLLKQELYPNALTTAVGLARELSAEEYHTKEGE